MVAILATLIIGTYYTNRPEPIISNAISKKANFNIAIPALPNTVNKASVRYRESDGVLTFSSQGQDGIIYIINEQSTPSAFTDSPQIYPALLQKMHEYAEVQTNRGNVALTQPEELKGGQTAVINTRGTLMFVHPDKNLTDDQWRQFFNSMINAQ